jgi:hypothetical protein
MRLVLVKKHADLPVSFNRWTLRTPENVSLARGTHAFIFTDVVAPIDANDDVFHNLRFSIPEGMAASGAVLAFAMKRGDLVKAYLYCSEPFDLTQGDAVVEVACPGVTFRCVEVDEPAPKKTVKKTRNKKNRDPAEGEK